MCLALSLSSVREMLQLLRSLFQKLKVGQKERKRHKQLREGRERSSRGLPTVSKYPEYCVGGRENGRQEAHIFLKRN